MCSHSNSETSTCTDMHTGCWHAAWSLLPFWQEHSEFLKSFYILGLIFKAVAITPVLIMWTPPEGTTTKGTTMTVKESFNLISRTAVLLCLYLAKRGSLSVPKNWVSVLMPISWNWPVTSSKWSYAALVWTTSFEGQNFVPRERLLSRCYWFY